MKGAKSSGKFGRTHRESPTRGDGATYEPHSLRLADSTLDRAELLQVIEGDLRFKADKLCEDYLLAVGEEERDEEIAGDGRSRSASVGSVDQDVVVSAAAEAHRAQRLLLPMLLELAAEVLGLGDGDGAVESLPPKDVL